MRKEKLDSLQALRALAFLGIFSSHAVVGNSLGAWGVSIFIVMSGFLMTYNYNDKLLEPVTIKNSLCFSLHKIRKLYGLHIVTLFSMIVLTCVDIFYGLSQMDYPQTIVGSVLDIFLVQTWVPVKIYSSSLNSVAWFLSVAMFFYTIYPYIHKKLKSIRSSAQAIKVIIFIYIIQIVLRFLTVNIYGFDGEFGYWFMYYFPLYRSGDFLIGCLLGVVYIEKYSTHTLGKCSIFSFSVLEIVLFLVSVISLFGFMKIPKDSILAVLFCETLFYLPIAVLIVYAFAMRGGIIEALH